MNKTEFLAAIAEKLGALSKSDMENSLAYYSEMVEDYMENGKTEEEAVAAIGTPEEIAAQILMEQPLPKIVKAKVKKSEFSKEDLIELKDEIDTVEEKLEEIIEEITD